MRFISQVMTFGSASWIQVKRRTSKTGERLLASKDQSRVRPSIARHAHGPPITHEPGLSPAGAQTVRTDTGLAATSPNNDGPIHPACLSDAAVPRAHAGADEAEWR